MSTQWITQEEVADNIPDFLKHFESLSHDDLYLRFNNVLTMESVENILQKISIDCFYEHIFYVLRRNDDNSIIGLCQLSRSLETSIGEISVSVSSELKGIGIGTCLMMHILLKAKEQGIKRIEMFINYENAPCRALAEKLGFKTRFEACCNLFVATVEF